MEIVDAVREVLNATGPPERDRGNRGAWWCMDCRERIPDSDVSDGTPPSCPECGSVMEFERSPDGPGCAC